MSKRPICVLVLALWLLVLAGTQAAPFLADMAAQLQMRRTGIERDRKALNADCAKVRESNGAKVAECKRRFDDVARRMAKYKSDYRDYEIILQAIAGERDFFLAIPKDDIRIPLGIQMLARKLKWGPDKLARLEKALKDLGFDGLDEITLENVEEGWRAIWRNSDNKDLARAADAAGKAYLPNVAQKENNDCVIAAMATASGLPYDDVAKRAKELISQGEWRYEYYRDNPQEAIKEGLNGGEVIMLAESLGRAEVVSASRFEETLKGGRSILVNLAQVITSKNGFPVNPKFGGHEVVLKKAFRHDGKTWFELADPAHPDHRFFVTPEDLKLTIQEKGVAYGQVR